MALRTLCGQVWVSQMISEDEEVSDLLSGYLQKSQKHNSKAAQEEETEDESDSESEDVAGHTVMDEDDTAAALASFSTRVKG